MARDVDADAVEFAGGKQRWDALAGGNLVQFGAGRGLVAELGADAVQPLLVPTEPGGVDVELVVEDAPGPDGGGHHVFGHSDALAGEVGGGLDAGAGPHLEAGVVEGAEGEDGQGHPRGVAPFRQHEQGGYRHLGNVEFGEAQLAPDKLAGVDVGGYEVDAVGFDRAVED